MTIITAFLLELPYFVFLVFARSFQVLATVLFMLAYVNYRLQGRQDVFEFLT